MNIGQKIKELRVNNKMTQNHLAELLGVSTQAVSRWENGKTYPDITLLPILAGIFEVSLDELLEFDIFKKQEEITKILLEDQKLANVGNNKKRIQLLKTALRKYPNSYQLMEKLANSLFGYYAEKDGERKYILDELIALCEKILANCHDDEIRHSIIALLSYSYKHNKEYDKAKDLALKMPGFYYCKDVLLSHVLLGAEKEIQNQKNTLKLTEWFYSIVAASTDKEPLTNVKLWDKYLKLLNIVFEDEDYGFYYTRVSYANLMIARNYAKVNDIDSSIKHFKLAIEYASKYAKRLNKSYHTSLMINQLVDEKEKTSTNTMSSEKELLKKELDRPLYNVIKNSQAYHQIIEALDSFL